jgi:uncharacterized protein (TIGR02001 family)
MRPPLVRAKLVRHLRPASNDHRPIMPPRGKTLQIQRVNRLARVLLMLLWVNILFANLLLHSSQKGNAMKKMILTAAVLSTLAAPSFAQTAAPASPHTFTGNLTVATDYRFRGISQTFRQPALQGGFDYSHSSGFYIGNWNSNVSGNLFLNGAGLEMDFYGGYKFEPVKDLTADIGLLYYYYPGAEIGATGVKYNNGEIYLGATYKWLSAKYSYGLTDFFGLKSTTAPVYAFTALPANGDSKGSGYLDLTANFEVADKTILTLHAGHQTIRHYGELDYTDYKIGIARDFGFATVGFAVIGTNADENYWKLSNTSGTKTKELGNTTAVLSVSKTF